LTDAATTVALLPEFFLLLLAGVSFSSCLTLAALIAVSSDWDWEDDLAGLWVVRLSKQEEEIGSLESSLADILAAVQVDGAIVCASSSSSLRVKSMFSSLFFQTGF
jgi:hypothetical protein